MVVSKFHYEDLGAVLRRVSSAFPGTSQLMDRKVCWDQAFLSMSFFHNHGLLLTACPSRWGKWCVIVSSLIVLRLAWEAGMNGTILEVNA